MKMLSIMLLTILLASQANAFVCEHSYSDGPKCSQRSLSATYTNNGCKPTKLVFKSENGSVFWRGAG